MRKTGLMWVRDDDTFMPARFEATGDGFELDHLAAALAFCPGRRVAIDVGAHYGSWTRQLARQFERVLAFEPVAETYACLKLNTADFPNAEIFPQAAGASAGSVSVGVGKMFSHPGMETVIGDGTVAMVAIDDLNLDALDFLKVDVEGFELRVLQGAERALRRFRPVVVFEENQRGPLEHGISNGECARFLEGLGAVFVTSRGKDSVFAWPRDAAEFSKSFERGGVQSVLGHVGHGGSREAYEVAASDYPAFCGRPFKVVSFYTIGDEYEAHAARLVASLDRFGIEHEVVGVPSLGVWESNCAFKAKFVRERWDASDVPIVWIDADATIEAPLALFGAIDADIGFHKWEDHKLASGTIYFGKSALARAVVDRWALRAEADPITWDQVHLHSAWCDVAAASPLRTVFLPRTYLQIFDGPRDEGAAIVHWQASRKQKAAGQTTGNPVVAITPEGIDDRRHNRLWRTAEELFWISEGTRHIIPDTGYQFPEGFDVGGALRVAVGDKWPVAEIGSGVGRVASLFAPDAYVGAELNPHAILEARRALPTHTFRIYDNGLRYPAAPTALLYTVLLHVADEDLPRFLREAAYARERFIIAEVMDSRWRRDGAPPVFNRNPEEYILAMQNLGFKFASVQKHPYKRYDQEPWNVGRDSRLTILVFDRVAGGDISV